MVWAAALAPFLREQTELVAAAEAGCSGGAWGSGVACREEVRRCHCSETEEHGRPEKYQWVANHIICVRQTLPKSRTAPIYECWLGFYFKG